MGVTIAGNFAMVAYEDSGLKVIDVSIPANPVLSGNFDTQGLALGVVDSQYYAFLADYHYFEIFDCSSALGIFPIEDLTSTISGNDIILNWERCPGASGYHIYYQNLPYFIPTGIPQAVVIPPDTSWTDENAILQGKRWYRMVVEY
jgi:hypothetical protein